MPLKKETCPRQVEDQLEALFDHALSSESGMVFHSCAFTRAKYLCRWAEWIRFNSALASVQMYSPDPLFAKGSYWNLKLTPADEGLFVERVKTIHLNPRMMIFQCIFLDKSFTMDCHTAEAALEKRRVFTSELDKLRKRVNHPNAELVYIYIDKKFPNLIRVTLSAVRQDTGVEIPKDEINKIHRLLDNPYDIIDDTENLPE